MDKVWRTRASLPPGPEEAPIGNAGLHVTKEGGRYVYYDRAQRGSATDRWQGHECLPHTRATVLQLIQDWASSPKRPLILVLAGLPGSGKSAIAQTATCILGRSGTSVMRLTLRNDDASTRPMNMAQSIAVHLGESMPELHRGLQDARSGLRASEDLDECFEHLLLNPLQMLVARHGSPVSLYKQILVVIDLDGHISDFDIGRVLTLLSRMQLLLNNLRVLVFCRPEQSFRLAIRRLSADQFESYSLGRVEEERADDDIRVYFWSRLRPSISRIMASSAQIDALVDIATPIFAIAAGICDYVFENPATAEFKLQQVIEQPQALLPVYRLLYQPIWDKVIEHASRETEVGGLPDSISVIGCIALLQDPLPLQHLSRLTGFTPAALLAHLESLHSVIAVPKNADADTPVAVYHDSFLAFLFEGTILNPAEIHHKLAERCLLQLTQPEVLREDLLGLCDSSSERANIDQSRIAAHISADTAYACRYWIFHSCQAYEMIIDDTYIHVFLRTHFLNWLEAMIWLGELQKVNDMLQLLYNHVKRGLGLCPHEFVDEAAIFVNHVQRVIGRTPLELYRLASTYGFTRSAETWLSHARYVDMQILFDGGFGRGPAQPQILEGNHGSVSAMNFSPDGGLLVLTNTDCITRLWDVSTGRMVSRTESDTVGPQLSVFAANGQFLMTASLTGEVTYRTPGGDVFAKRSLLRADDTPIDLAFAGTTTAYLFPRYVELWNVISGSLIRRIHFGPGAAGSIRLSPDGNRLAIVMSDSSPLTQVQSYNASSGSLLSEKPFPWTSAFILSDDGQLIVEIINNRAGIVYDIVTGRRICSIDHEGEKIKLLLSPDRALLVTLYEDRVVLWGALTGKQTRRLEGLKCPASVMAISPDSSQLAVLSQDGKILVWRLHEEPITQLDQYIGQLEQRVRPLKQRQPTIDGHLPSHIAYPAVDLAIDHSMDAARISSENLPDNDRNRDDDSDLGKIMNEVFCTPELTTISTEALGNPRLGADSFHKELRRLITDFGTALRSEAMTEDALCIADQLQSESVLTFVADGIVGRVGHLQKETPEATTTARLSTIPLPGVRNATTYRQGYHPLIDSTSLAPIKGPTLSDMLSRDARKSSSQGLVGSLPSSPVSSNPLPEADRKLTDDIFRIAGGKSRKRTKTGCLTCRKRRIKCGEERPVCKNCIKSRRECEGYTQRTLFKKPSDIRLLPRQSASVSFQAGFTTGLLTNNRNLRTSKEGFETSQHHPNLRDVQSRSNSPSGPDSVLSETEWPIPPWPYHDGDHLNIPHVWGPQIDKGPLSDLGLSSSTESAGVNSSQPVARQLRDSLLSSKAHAFSRLQLPNFTSDRDAKGFLLESKAYVHYKMQLFKVVHDPYFNVMYAALGKVVMSESATGPSRKTTEASRRTICREMTCIPPSIFTISDRERLSILDHLKCRIEDLMGESWFWWPLGPRKYDLHPEYRRLKWQTPCGETRFIDLPKAAADRVLEATRWAPKFIQNASFKTDSSSKVAVPESSTAHTGTSSTTSTAEQKPSAGHQEANTSQTSTSSSPSNAERPPHAQATDRHVYLGVKSGSLHHISALRTDTMTTDVEFFHKLKEQYLTIRGTLRLWFSIWRYDHCQFYRFRKYGFNLSSPIRIDFPPDADEKYEFDPRPMDDRPPHGPISDCEFRDHFYRSCAHPAACHSWHRHALQRWVFCGQNTSALHALPKRVEELGLGDGRREEFWGIFARERRGFAWVLAYAVLCNLPGVIFFFLWLFRWKHAADLQDGAVPVGLSVSLTICFVTLMYESRERER